MKIFSVLAGMVLLAGCATVSNLSGPVNIDGTWRGKVAMGGGFGSPPVEMEIIYHFERDGEILKGTVSGEAPDSWIPISDGEIEGAKISFTVEVPSQWMASTFYYKGKFIDNDTINMRYRMKMKGGGMGMPPPSVTQKLTINRVE